jgi:predicted RNA-binding Zn-ribbon protein involved in translation (DUF1610 family)
MEKLKQIFNTLLNSFLCIFGPYVPKHEKDPSDYTLTDSSTRWSTDKYYCTGCKKSVRFDDYLDDLCPYCGRTHIESKGRDWRKIYIDSAWKYQVKYRKTKQTEIINEWY